MNIRDFTPGDYGDIVNIHNVLHPENPTGASQPSSVKCIAYAKARGVAIIETGNNMNNRPMRAINNRLGFVKQPDSIDFEKDCRTEPAMIPVEAIQRDY